MASAATSVEVTNVSDAHQLWRVLEEVRASKTPRLIRRNGIDVAVVMPVEELPSVRRPPRRTLSGEPLSPNDPLAQLIGSARSDSPGDVSGDKYKYLARAYDTAKISAAESRACPTPG